VGDLQQSQLSQTILKSTTFIPPPKHDAMEHPPLVNQGHVSLREKDTEPPHELHLQYSLARSRGSALGMGCL
jgi:hypothetical protein